MARYNWNTKIVWLSVVAAMSSIQDWDFWGDSTNGCQAIDLFTGSRDLALQAFMPKIRVCAGGLWVAPIDNGGWITARPGIYPFMSSIAILNCNMPLMRNAATGYANAAASPDSAYGSAATPGETKVADLIDICEVMIPQGGDPWPTNGTGGTIMYGISSNSAVIRSGFAIVASESDFSFTTQRFAKYFEWVPGYGTGTRAAIESVKLHYVRRAIPTGASGTEYDTAAIPIQFQRYNGNGTGITALPPPNEPSYTMSSAISGANWANVGGVIPTSSPGVLATASIGGLSTYGFASHTNGGDYNDPQTARGFAFIGCSFLFEGVTHGLRTSCFTRGGFKADTLNDAAFDGSETDPQRVVLEQNDPDLIFLTFGANDVAASVAYADFAAELFEFMERVWTYRPNQKFVYMANYAGAVGDAHRAIRGQYAAEMYHLARTANETRLAIIDLWTPGQTAPLSYFNTSHLAVSDVGVSFFVRALKGAVVPNRGYYADVYT